MTKEFKEAYKAVEDLNDELTEAQGESDDEIAFSVTSNGYITLINIDITAGDISVTGMVYCSEEDDRRYDEESDEYEEFYNYLLRKYREFKKNLDSMYQRNDDIHRTHMSM